MWSVLSDQTYGEDDPNDIAIFNKEFCYVALGFRPVEFTP